jgi:hypothetical protein
MCGAKVIYQGQVSFLLIIPHTKVTLKPILLVVCKMLTVVSMISRPKALEVLDHSNTGIANSNIAGDMDECVRPSVLCCPAWTEALR